MFSFNKPVRGSAPVPVSSNIQDYLARATLPRLRLANSTPKPPSELIQSNLAVLPECPRSLRRMYRISRKYGDHLCLDFIQKHIPHMPVQVGSIDPDDEEWPTIPCEGYDVPAFRVPPLLHIDGLRVSWLENYVLRTVQAVLRMIPEYRDIIKDYTFIDVCTSAMFDEDQQIFQYFMWQRSATATRNKNAANDKPVKLILAFQPPWILPPQNLKEFAGKRPKILPTRDELEASGAEGYSGLQKVWAKLWDVCKRNDCSSFVLTNYDQWVFGGFIKDYERGFTMDVKKAYPPETMEKQNPGSKGKHILPSTPTILEFLIYWIISSMRLPDHFTLPPVPEEIDLETAINDTPQNPMLGLATPTQAFSRKPVFRDYTPSESDSTDQSIGAGEHLGSDPGNAPPPFPDITWGGAPGPRLEPVRVQANGLNVDGWPMGFNNLHTSTAPSMPRPPSPVLSEWSEVSCAVREPRRSQGLFNIGTIMEEVYES